MTYVVQPRRKREERECNTINSLGMHSLHTHLACNMQDHMQQNCETSFVNSHKSHMHMHTWIISVQDAMLEDIFAHAHDIKKFKHNFCLTTMAIPNDVVAIPNDCGDCQ